MTLKAVESIHASSGSTLPKTRWLDSDGAQVNRPLCAVVNLIVQGIEEVIAGATGVYAERQGDLIQSLRGDLIPKPLNLRVGPIPRSEELCLRNWPFPQPVKVIPLAARHPPSHGCGDRQEFTHHLSERPQSCYPKPE